MKGHRVNIGPDELTGTEQAVLLVLLAEARAVPNPELGQLGPELRRENREKLNRKGLVESTKVGRSYVHELTDDGWALGRKLVGAPTPPASSGQGKALYTLMRGLDRYLTRAELPLSELFAAADAEPPQLPSDQARVQQVYGRLAAQSGDWVALVRLRAELPDVDHQDLDDTLRRMYRIPGVHLIPEENQKVLTDDDRLAAVVIGEQHKHLIAIES
jgi:ATP-dependent Clp protease ATP-binding subunit ClpA